MPVLTTPTGPADHTGKALRIGLLIDDSLDRPDGVQQYVLTLGAWLTSCGHEVHYISSSTHRQDLANLHVLGKTLGVRFNGNSLGTPLPIRARAARSLVEQLDLDILHVQMPYSPLLAGRVIDAVTAWNKRGGHTRLVGTFHIYPDSRLTRYAAWALGLSQRRRLARFDKVLAVSGAAQEFAADSFGIETTVIGNPVDTAVYARAAIQAGQQRRAAKVDANAAVAGTSHVVFLGRLVPRKGPGQLIEALALLHRQAPDLAWRATIAGRGPLLDQLQALTVTHGIEGRCSFPGFIDEQDKAGLLASADVVALPSLGGESFGISVVEALAASAGIVLAGDNPGYRTVMRGLEPQLVKPEETATFAAVLEASMEALGDPVARAVIVAAQHHVAAQFDTSVIGQAVLDIYRQTVAAGQ